MKKTVAFMLIAAMLLVCAAGLAATPVNGSGSNIIDSSASLSSVYTFKFEHRKKGIGKGVCPVYSAPYEDAYRAANGKACVDTNSSVDLGGFSNNGWLLVRYETSKGSTRVGWIPPKYVKNVTTPMSPHFSYIPVQATASVYVTDDNLSPYNTKSYFARIEAGETYYVLGRYNYYGDDLWYIEFELDGQMARGFIPV